MWTCKRIDSINLFRVGPDKGYPVGDNTAPVGKSDFYPAPFVRVRVIVHNSEIEPDANLRIFVHKPAHGVRGIIMFYFDSFDVNVLTI